MKTKIYAHRGASGYAPETRWKRFSWRWISRRKG